MTDDDRNRRGDAVDGQSLETLASGQNGTLEAFGFGGDNPEIRLRMVDQS